MIWAIAQLNPEFWCPGWLLGAWSVIRNTRVLTVSLPCASAVWTSVFWYANLGKLGREQLANNWNVSFLEDPDPSLLKNPPAIITESPANKTAWFYLHFLISGPSLLALTNKTLLTYAGCCDYLWKNREDKYVKRFFMKVLWQGVIEWVSEYCKRCFMKTHGLPRAA